MGDSVSSDSNLHKTDNCDRPRSKIHSRVLSCPEALETACDGGISIHGNEGILAIDLQDFRTRELEKKSQPQPRRKSKKSISKLTNFKLPFSAPGNASCQNEISDPNAAVVTSKASGAM